MTWTQIPVRIRHQDADTARPVGICDADDISDIIDTVQRWGTVGGGGVVGQFNEHDGCFEIVVVDD